MSSGQPSIGRAGAVFLAALAATTPLFAGSLVCNGATISFDAGPPSDWSSIDRAGSGLRWLSLAACGEGANFSGGAGGAACLSADRFGPAIANAELITPLFSLATAAAPVLTYRAHYPNFAGLDALQVDGSRDGGVTWLPLLAWQEDHGLIRTSDGEQVRLNLTPLAGSANVRLRWRYLDPRDDAFGWLAQIDDVAVACDDPGCAYLPNPVVDPSYEGSGWTALSSSGPSPLCAPATCGVSAARSGAGYLRLGGTGSVDSSSASQTATLPLGIGTLSFYVWIPTAGTPGDELQVSVDGALVATVSASDEKYRSGYRKFEVGISNWSDGASHQISLSSSTSGAAAFFIDDAAVPVCPTSVDNPVLSVTDVSVAEGNSGLTTAAVRLRLASPTRQTVTVPYRTRDGSAISGQDYQAITGTANFEPGTTVVEVPIAVAADTVDELDETFLFEIGPVTNATAPDLEATVTIVDDDQTWISVGDGAALEVDGTTSTSTFLVSLSRANSAIVQVDWRTVAGTATSGADYQNLSGTATFQPGVTQATVTVPVFDDLLPERDETFTVLLSNPRSAAIEDPEGLGRIYDNDRGRRPNVGTDIVYTVDADFDLGRLHNLTYTETADQLQLIRHPAPLPNLWVAATNRATIVKIDTRTGAILGEYRTAPQAGAASFPSPSRTTVALDGSVWAGNRNDRSIVHVGLVESGQCVDRNGDGVIQTSRGWGDVLAWPNADGRDNDGGIETAVDECLLHFTRTSSGGIRHLSIDAQNRLWVTGIEGRVFDLVDGDTGAIVESRGPMPCGGYGGLVDRNGVVWSATLSGSVLRWDPSVDPPTASTLRCITGVAAYGLAAAPDGDIWVSAAGQDRVWKIRGDGNLVSGPYRHGSAAAQGITTSANGDLWVSSAQWANLPTIGHLRADGTYLGNVAGVPRGTTGVAVDGDGKVWAISLKESSAARIDPLAGPFGADGVTRVGKVDLVVPLTGAVPAAPYNYSDMTGALVFGNTAPRGTFRVLQDAGVAGASWGRIRWNSESAGRIPAGAAVQVEARTADSEALLGSTPPIVVSNDTPFASVGKLIEVVVTLIPNAAGESPVLSDLRVSTAAGADPLERKVYVSNAEVTEANIATQSMVFTITLSTPSDGTVKVDYATSPGNAAAVSDYIAATGTASFAPNEVSKTVAVTIVGDTSIESDEFFFVDLSAPVATGLGDARGVGTIFDNDGVAVPVVSDDRLYTLDEDFDLGALWNTHHEEPLEDQLQVVQEVGPFPYLWVAARARGTIIKIDTRTGEKLGEYSAYPNNITHLKNDPGEGPSRTTVALDGSVWAGNRYDSSVVHVGLVEEGQCVDRNGNGAIETSTRYGEVLGWATGVGGVSTALDECILHYVKVRGSAPRHVSVDRSGNIWIASYGGSNDRDFQLIDGKTGAILRTEHDLPCGGYGGLIDKNGILWSVHHNGRILRWDPATAKTSARCVGPSDLMGYGIALGRGGSIYVTDSRGRGNPPVYTVWKIAPDGNSWSPIVRPNPCAQGLAVDDDEQVWVSSSRWCSGTTVAHLNGTSNVSVGQVSGVATGSTGIAVDAAGKIWAIGDQASRADRIDPTKGGVGTGGIRIGAVDLQVGLGATTNPTRAAANPYNYSDMTGYLAIRNTAPLGRWRVIQDGGQAASLWGRVTWNSEGEGTVPAGGSIVVEVRAADTLAALGSRTFVAVTNGTNFSQLGRFLEVRVTLRPNASGVSPVLADLRIETVDSVDPARVSIAPASVVEGDAGFVTALFPVTLSRAETREVKVDWRASAGSALAAVDFEALQGTAVFPPGTTEALIEVPVRGDLLSELDETFTVELERPVFAEVANGQGLGTIVDDDEPATLSIDDAEVVEGDAGTVNVTFAVTLSPAMEHAVRFDWASEDGTATAAADYRTGAHYLILEPGTTTAQIVIQVEGDLDPEDDETFRVVLSGADGAALGKGVGVGTILDDDAIELRIGDVTVEEGDSGTTPATFELTGSRPFRAGASVAYQVVAESATAGGDYVAGAGTLPLSEGLSVATVDVLVNGDLLLEPDETFRVELLEPQGVLLVDGLGVGTILDDEECVGPNLLRNPGAEERPVAGELPGWSEVLGTSWTWRRFSTTLPAYEGDASFAAGAVVKGELAQTVSVLPYAATIDAGAQEFAFRGFLRSASVIPPDFARIAVEYLDESGEVLLDVFDSGDLIADLEWSEIADVRSAPVGTRYLRVRLLAKSMDGEGENGAAFDGLELRSLRTAAVTMTGFDTPEGDSGVHDGAFTVSLSCQFAEPVTVGVSTANGTATAGSDYLGLTTELTFAPGETSKPVPVPVVGDTVDEPHETLFLDVVDGSFPGLSGAVIVEPRETGVIRNDDWCPRTQGYWKDHPTLWPVDWLKLGSLEYGQAWLITMMATETTDMSKILARQLVATKLNLLRGSKGTTIQATVDAADAFLTRKPIGSNPTGADRTEAEQLKNQLDLYNRKGCEGL